MNKDLKDPAREFELEDTLIEEGGVYRCCTGTVAREYVGKKVKVGDKSECQHCHTKFTLRWVGAGETSAYQIGVRLRKPIWTPDED